MFDWFKAKSPLKLEQRTWIDERFAWLKQEFGPEPLDLETVTPTAEFFPDHYSATFDDVSKLLDQLCIYMDVDRERIDLQLYISPSADSIAAAYDPARRGGFALGKYEMVDGRITIRLEQTRLSEPYSVVSTLAHELAHVHLLADGRIDENVEDHERLTDLLTVYFGLGIVRANASIREFNWCLGGVSGWSAERHGYLIMAEYAYALALYAHARGERQPTWNKFLRPDARSLFDLELKHRFAETRPPSTHDKASTAESDERSRSGGSSPIEQKTEDQEEKRAVSDEETHDDEADRARLSSSQTDEWVIQGAMHFAAGDCELALEAYSHALEAHPEDAEAWAERARAHLALRKRAQAVEDCNRSLRCDPDEVSALLYRAEAYLWLRRFSDALEDVNQYLRVESKRPLAYYIRGLANLALSDSQQAIADLSFAIRLAPTCALNYLARSRAYDASRRTEDAKTDLAEAILRDPELADADRRKDLLPV